MTAPLFGAAGGREEAVAGRGEALDVAFWTTVAPTTRLGSVEGVVLSTSGLPTASAEEIFFLL